MSPSPGWDEGRFNVILGVAELIYSARMFGVLWIDLAVCKLHITKPIVNACFYRPCFVMYVLSQIANVSLALGGKNCKDSFCWRSGSELI